MGHPSQKVTAVGTRQALALALAVAVVAVVGLALAEAFHLTLLVDPVDSIEARGLAAWIGVGLLVVDIVLPVPSSMVMLAHGALFGVIPGAALSLLGRTGNALVGVLIGSGAGNLLSRRSRGRSAADSGKGAELVGRWGLAAVVFTRPIPVLAESTLVAAAAMGLSPLAVIAAAVVGALPEDVLYAVAGEIATYYANGAIVFVAVMALAAAAWAASARIEKARAQRGVTLDEPAVSRSQRSRQ
jgi:uncharacterized membrane protein YdjX (TVP38/TMEM64 family)